MRQQRWLQELLRGNTKKVTKDQYEALLLGNYVIQKGWLYFLRGRNAHGQCSLSDTFEAVDSKGRVRGGEEIADAEIKEGKESLLNPLKVASWEVKADAGNDREMASLIYLLCLDAFPSEAKVTLMSCSTRDHQFVRVCSKSYDIAVDMWPTHPQAVLWEDHFCSKWVKALCFKFGEADAPKGALKKENYLWEGVNNILQTYPEKSYKQGCTSGARVTHCSPKGIIKYVV